MSLLSLRVEIRMCNLPVFLGVKLKRTVFLPPIVAF